MLEVKTCRTCGAEVGSAAFETNGDVEQPSLVIGSRLLEGFGRLERAVSCQNSQIERLLCQHEDLAGKLRQSAPSWGIDKATPITRLRGNWDVTPVLSSPPTTTCDAQCQATLPCHFDRTLTEAVAELEVCQESEPSFSNGECIEICDQVTSVTTYGGALDAERNWIRNVVLRDAMKGWQETLDMVPKSWPRCMKHSIKKCIRGVMWYTLLAQPSRTGICARIIESQKFEFACGIAILLNAAYIVYDTDYGLRHLSARGPTKIMNMIEICFLVIYTVELGLKLSVHRCYFFAGANVWWNVFDLVLVVVSMAELIFRMIAQSGNGDNGVDLLFLRSGRLFKVVKILRMFRTLRLFAELRLMIDCVLQSFLTLFWCLAMITFFLYIFALFFAQSLETFLIENSHRDLTTDEEVIALRKRFGSVSHSMMTLFQAATGGKDWAESYELVSMTGKLSAVLFALYIALFFIAIWNIVTSTFVEKAFKLAQPDVESLLIEKHRANEEDSIELKKIFAKMDLDKSQGICYKEFMDVAANAEFLAILDCRGIDVKDAILFFRLLLAGGDSDEVDLNTFVAGCLRMKGYATSVDLHTLSFQTKLMHKNYSHFQRHCLEELQRIRSAVDGQLTQFQIRGSSQEPLINRVSMGNRLSMVKKASAQESIGKKVTRRSSSTA